METAAEPRLDPIEVDRSFVLSLFHGFCNSVPNDMRKKLVSEQTDVLQFMLAVRPRITPFAHRQLFSLRHPAVSWMSRRYFTALRTFLDENDLRNTEQGISCTSTPTRSGCEPADRSSRNSTLLPASLNPKSIKAKDLRAYNWNCIESCHKILIGESPFSALALESILSNEKLLDIVRRYWDRLTCPTTGADIYGAFDASGTVHPRNASSPVPELIQRANQMTPTQYTYLHMRFAQILLPPGALEAEIFDGIISDLRVDGKYPRRTAGLFPPASAVGPFLQDTVDILLDPERHIAKQMLPNLSDNVSMEGEMNSIRSALALPKTGASLLALPEITFAQFFYSIVELADNWTSTAHPNEYVAFLTELYCEAFGHDWDDEDPVLKKAFRPAERTPAPLPPDSRTSNEQLADQGDPAAHLLAEYATALSASKPPLYVFNKITGMSQDYRRGVTSAVRDLGLSRPRTGEEQADVTSVSTNEGLEVGGRLPRRQRRSEGSFIEADSEISGLEGLYEVGDVDDRELRGSQRARLPWRPHDRRWTGISRGGSLSSFPETYNTDMQTDSCGTSPVPESFGFHHRPREGRIPSLLDKRKSVTRAVCGEGGELTNRFESGESRESFELSMSRWESVGTEGSESRVDKGRAFPSSGNVTPESAGRRSPRKRKATAVAREGGSKSKRSNDAKASSGAASKARSVRSPGGGIHHITREGETEEFDEEAEISDSSSADDLHSGDERDEEGDRRGRGRKPGRARGHVKTLRWPEGSGHSETSEYDDEQSEEGLPAIYDEEGRRLHPPLHQQKHKGRSPRTSQGFAVGDADGSGGGVSAAYGYNARMLQGKGRWLSNTEMKCELGVSHSPGGGGATGLRPSDERSEGSDSDNEALAPLLLDQKRIEQKLRELEAEQQRLQASRGRGGRNIHELLEGTSDGVGRLIKFRLSSVERKRLTTEEVNQYRNVIINRLLAKGVNIPPESLTDDDVLNLMEDNLQPELVQRLMQLMEGYSEDLACSDLLDALLSDDAKIFTASGAMEASVLGALCKKSEHRPVETAYMRYLREKRERELREEIKAAKERYRATQNALREAQAKDATPTAVVPITEHIPTPPRAPAFLPALPLLSSARVGGPKRPTPKGPNAFYHEMDDFDTVVHMRPQPPSRGPMHLVPRHPLFPRRLPQAHRARFTLPSIHLPTQRYANEYYCEEDANGIRVRIHSKRRLRLFYREIRVDRPILGRAPLAPLTSIIGGTYHQLAALRVRCRRRRRFRLHMLRNLANERNLLPLPRYVPVKLFSLTTKTTLAEALRESLMCYINDKAYLDTLYGDMRR